MRMLVIALSLLGTLVMSPLPVSAASTTITLAMRAAVISLE
mgnify:CR=1 FL=1